MIANRRWLAPLGIVAVLALALAWWHPWQADTPKTPRPVALIPTRTPTVAPATVLVAVPTIRPLPSAPPSSAPLPTPVANAPRAATPQPRAATPATPAANVAAGGTLFYLGFVNGHGGVVASNADGSNQRLLVPMLVGTLIVSPDATRLATVGPIQGGDGAYQLTIFSADGKLQARYPYGRGTRGALTWSPDGRYLLGSFLSTENGEAAHWETWVYGDDDAWPVAPPAPDITFPFSWTPDNRIAFLGSEDPARPRRRTLWTTNVVGEDVQTIFAGPLIPLGWNREGTLLYALAYSTPDDQDAALNVLVAIELPSGNVRTVAGASGLAAGALGVPNLAGTYRFDFAIPSPDGGRFAIGLAKLAGPGTPTSPAGSRATSIIFLRLDGLITGTATLPPGGVRGPNAWSADGSRFALLVSGEREGDGQILALDTTGHRLAAFTIERTSTGLIPPQLAWSGNGQWLAYTGNSGLVAATIPADSGTLIDPGGTQPAWRP